MENTIKTFKEHRIELVKALGHKRNACISKQDTIRELWHDTEQVIRGMEDDTDTFDIDKYDEMCDNTNLYSNINQRIDWQLDMIDDIIRALDEIEANLEELDYQDTQIHLYRRRIK